jgi:hypothetical protein
MIRQQQLRTSPVAVRIKNRVILFLALHISEIRFPIPACSVGCGASFEFMLLSHPYKSWGSWVSLQEKCQANNKEKPPGWMRLSTAQQEQTPWRLHMARMRSITRLFLLCLLFCQLAARRLKPFRARHQHRMELPSPISPDPRSPFHLSSQLFRCFDRFQTGKKLF